MRTKTPLMRLEEIKELEPDENLDYTVLGHSHAV